MYNIKLILGTASIIGMLFSEVMGQGFQIPLNHSLYSDHKARDVEDVITIILIEFSEANNQSVTSTSKSDNIALSVDPATGPLSALPSLSFGTSSSNSFAGEGATTRKGSLRGKMTATIKEILPNGYFRVEGKRTIKVNQDKQEMKLEGIVRPRDIMADNTVFSYNIADAKIQYVGKGAINRSQRMGLLRRILNWFL